MSKEVDLHVESTFITGRKKAEPTTWTFIMEKCVDVCCLEVGDMIGYFSKDMVGRCRDEVKKKAASADGTYGGWPANQVRIEETTTENEQRRNARLNPGADRAGRRTI